MQQEQADQIKKMRRFWLAYIAAWVGALVLYVYVAY
jgi:hypothetical protein